MSTSVGHPTSSRTRLRLAVQGRVQGVGFRPFVFQLASQCHLSGWIENTPQGATIEIEGHSDDLELFQRLLPLQAPPTAKIETIATSSVSLRSEKGFFIRASQTYGTTLSVIPPDLGTCQECLYEINDPASRRYRYPFTTCTQCGPRYSIVEEIPFDRINTTMKQFPLCDACQKEYEDMAHRRFHAEAIACPTCGPHLELWDSKGKVLAKTEEALQQACPLVQNGKILAVKGLGGFQLWVDAQSEAAIQHLRARKHRPRKPFAVLFPSLEILRRHCECSKEEENLLTSPETPIVLLRRKENSSLAPAVAPDNPYVGAMLPNTPLHHLLIANLQTPVVATSGNRSEEPIVIDEREALPRLTGIADAFLIHNRPIARPIDDSVVRIINGELMMLRRARGYAPAPMTIKIPGSKGKTLLPVLAVGGHLKNTVAVTTQNQVVMSQHIGDLSTPEAYAQLERTVSDQLKLFNVEPQAIACDMHPDYRSTTFAKKLGHELRIPAIPIQHHYAHILSCMAEHGLEGPVLGVAWDGAGYGTDGTIWGGEFLLADYSGFTRVGYLKPFRLPGGEICMREPSRVALSLLYETYGDECLRMDLPPLQSLGPDLAQSLVELLKKDVNCPITTSMGRLFDGISSILGLCHNNTFEGEAAMALEFAAEKSHLNTRDMAYSIPLFLDGKEEESSSNTTKMIADWRYLMREVVKATLEGKSINDTSLRFHQTLKELIEKAAGEFNRSKIVLSGGVFQNSFVHRHMKSEFQESQITFYTNKNFSPNDGGIALGQVVGLLNKNLRI